VSKTLVILVTIPSLTIDIGVQLIAKKTGTVRNIDTFLQFFHSVKSMRDRLELLSKLNDIFKNHLTDIVK
jgi:hypothetical protein